MKNHLKDLLEYSHHSNIKIIEKFNDGDLHFVIPDSTKSLFSHILNAQSIWNGRMEANKEKVDVWKILNDEKLVEIENENYRKSLELLDSKDLNEEINYQNSKGEQYRNSVQEILIHIVNHSTYHRGQIAVEFRQKGIEPVVSDYIFYKRDK